MKINKSDFLILLREKIALETNIKLKAKDIPILYDAFMDIIKVEVEKNNSILFPRLGALTPVDRSDRDIYVPSIKKVTHFDERKSLKFIKSELYDNLK